MTLKFAPSILVSAWELSSTIDEYATSMVGDTIADTIPVGMDCLVPELIIPMHMACQPN